jgi:hypothetical protein
MSQAPATSAHESALDDNDRLGGAGRRETPFLIPFGNNDETTLASQSVLQAHDAERSLRLASDGL